MADTADKALAEIIEETGVTLRGSVWWERGLIIKEGTPYEEWSPIGADLEFMSTSIPFAYGDWLAYGADRFSDRYTQAVAATGKKTQTLRNWFYVATHVPPRNRVVAKDHSHCAVVASIEDKDEQRSWLILARDNKWTRNEFRAAVLASRSEDSVVAPDDFVEAGEIEEEIEIDRKPAPEREPDEMPPYDGGITIPGEILLVIKAKLVRAMEAVTEEDYAEAYHILEALESLFGQRLHS